MSAKRIKALLCASLAALFCLFSLTACLDGEGAHPVGMVNAAADFAEYRLFVPEKWVISQSGGAVSAYVSESDPTNVSVMSWEMPYLDSTVADWWESYRAEFDTFFTGFALLSEEDTVLDGVAARKYVYNGTLGENTYKYTQLAAVRAGVVYVITFTELASGENAVDHSTDISDITVNFRWKK